MAIFDIILAIEENKMSIDYKGIKIRVCPENNNIIQTSSDGGHCYNNAYEEPTFRDFRDLSVEGERIYATSSRGRIWSSNFGHSWHI